MFLLPHLAAIPGVDRRAPLRVSPDLGEAGGVAYSPSHRLKFRWYSTRGAVLSDAAANADVVAN